MDLSAISKRLCTPKTLPASKSAPFSASAFDFSFATSSASSVDLPDAQPVTKSQSAQSPLSSPRAAPRPPPVTGTTTKSSVRVFEGSLFKRGKVNKAWKERWFVMTLDFRLNYYESESKSKATFIVKNDRNQLGSIDLLAVEKIEVSLIKDTAVTLIPKYFRILASDKECDGDRSYLIHLVTTSRIFRLSAVDCESFVAWLHALHDYLYGGTLFESHLRKKGEVNKAWKRRYFVLNKYKQLKYYNNERRELLYGVIDVSEAQVSAAAAEQCIMLITEKRTWQLRCDALDLFQEWMAYLSGIDEHDEVKHSKYVPIYHQPQHEQDTYAADTHGHRIEAGAIFALWMQAQQELANGVVPHLLSDAGFALQSEFGAPPRKTISCVSDIQQFLNECTSIALTTRSLSNMRRSGVMDVDAADSSSDEDDEEEEEE